MKALIDNDEIKIIVADEFTKYNKTPNGRPISNYIVDNTKEKLKLYKKIFNMEKLDKITYEIFDDMGEWKKLYTERFNDIPPEYSRGYLKNEDRLSSCMQHSKPIYGTPYWYNTVCINAHEAFHYYYKKYIYGEDRVVWFDEGMAQFLSSESD